MWLFLTIWVGLQCVIVVFPDHTQFLHTLVGYRKRQLSGTVVHSYLEIPPSDPLKYIVDNPSLIVFISIEISTRRQRFALVRGGSRIS